MFSSLILVTSLTTAIHLYLNSNLFVHILVPLSIIFFILIGEDEDEMPGIFISPLLLIIPLLLNGGSWIKDIYYDPLVLFAFLFEYLVIGLLYGIFRWIYKNYSKAKYLNKHQKELETQYENIYHNMSLGRPTFKQYLIRHNHIPTFNKTAFTNQVIFWPFNMLTFLLSDFIFNVIKNIKNILKYLLEGVFEYIQNIIFSFFNIKT